MNSTKTITATITSIRKFYSGKRLLLDFMEEFDATDSIFVGNTMNGLFLIPSENRQSINYLPRKFRFNAGAIHQYVASPSGVKYLDELIPGDEIIISTQAQLKTVPVARTKCEIRDFVKIEAIADNNTFSVILQDGDTTALLTPQGLKYLAELNPGTPVLVRLYDHATHLGNPIDEFCEEK